MKTVLKRLLCISLTLALVICFMAVPVSAKGSKEIVFDEKGHFECVSDPDGEFSLKIERPSYVTIRIENSTDRPELSMTNEFGYMIELSQGFWETGNMLYGPLAAGNYIVKVDSKIKCDLKADIFDGYFTVEASGSPMTFNPYCCYFFPMHIYVEENETAKISFYNPRKQDVKIYITKNGVKKETSSTDLKLGDDLQIRVEYLNYDKTLDIKVSKDAGVKIKCDAIRCALAEPGSTFKAQFPYVSPNKDAEPRLYFWVRGSIHDDSIVLENPDDTVSFENVKGAFDINARLGTYAPDPYASPEQFASVYVFVKDTSQANKIELDQEMKIELKPTRIDGEQLVYSFAPEEDGIFNMTSACGSADPLVAVFDSKDNCIAWQLDEEYYQNEDYTIGMIGYEKPHNIDLNVEMKAGQTYYIYMKNYGTSEFAIRCSYEARPSFEDFVERLYVVALGRASEPEGKAFWTEHVGNGDLNGAQCANEFLLSKEFNDRNLSDEDFLKVLYKTFFDRKAEDDKDGFDFWMNSLKTQGRDVVVDCFINSTEWCNVCATYGVKSGATRAKATIASKNATAFATRLYTECLGREPEEGGLKFWSLGLTNLELTGSAAAHEFFFCKEFNDHNFDNKELITRMYRTFMGREPDDAGMTFWLDSMSKGMTKQQVFDSFVKSPEFTQICKDYAIERG